MAVTLASFSLAILAFSERNSMAQLYGIMLLPVAVCFICYAIYTFHVRYFLLTPRPHHTSLSKTFDRREHVFTPLRATLFCTCTTGLSVLGIGNPVVTKTKLGRQCWLLF
jgi:hypothetical protein